MRSPGATKPQGEEGVGIQPDDDNRKRLLPYKETATSGQTVLETMDQPAFLSGLSDRVAVYAGCFDAQCLPRPEAAMQIGEHRKAGLCNRPVPDHRSFTINDFQSSP